MEEINGRLGEDTVISLSSVEKIFGGQRRLNLLSPWELVERESRKVFGNASPDVISERNDLVQECL